MSSSDQEARITIELDVFSGRPNPLWELAGGPAQILINMVDEIRRSGRDRLACSTPGLGYRGIKLTIAQGSLISNWHVYADCIELNGQSFDDANRAVEAYVLQSMPTKLQSDLAGVLPHIKR
jgi:hypothetical protein